MYYIYVMKSINYKTFLREYKELIEKEKKSNKSVKGRIIKITKDTIIVSIKYPMGYSKNTIIEVNRIKSVIIENNNKKLKIKLLEKSKLKNNQVVSIHNVQKEIIIRKLQETLDNILYDKINESNKETLNVLIEDTNPTFKNVKYNNSKLNKNQETAVKKSLQADKFYLIQGPPGTGKTHTIIEIIKELHKNNKRVLITTHTHIALDNILEKLDIINEEEILRIGRKENIMNKIWKYSMDEQIKKHDLYDLIIEKQKNIEELKKSNFQIQNESNLEKKEGIFSRIIKYVFNLNDNNTLINNNLDEYYDKNEQIRELEEEISQISESIKHEIFKNKSIIATTVLSASNTFTKDIEFDYVIMDEASQVPVYLALIPLMKTDKFILIGDNKQLQPISNFNASYSLNKSIFNLLIEKYPDNYTFLNIQYRMNEEISNIASNLYYKGQLLTGELAKNKRITLNSNKYFFLNDNPLTLINTSNVYYFESNIYGGCCNKYESNIILNIVKSLVEENISPSQIGVITPYKKQKSYLKSLFQKEKLNVETDTIYRFQGREKDVIIVSFCKSSNKSLTKFQKNFLADENQLNVSITRSRKKLILIGDMSLLSNALNIKKLVKEVSPINTIYLEDLI